MGSVMSSRISNNLRIASSTVGFTILVFKTLADISKHQTHEGHSQRCPCLGVCYVCLWENATKKRKTAV
jgi:hypothetical protein